MADPEVQRILKAKNLYDVLQVPKDVGEDDLKRAYKKLALLTHPDKCKAAGAEEAFKSVGKAYTTLSDAQKRQLYDRHGEEGLQQGGAPRAYQQHFEQDDIYDLFAQMFGDPRMGNRHFYYTTRRAGGGTYTYARYAPQEEEPGVMNGPPWAVKIVQILPMILFFVVFLLFSVGFNETAAPYSLSYDPAGGYTRKRSTRDHKLTYYVPTSFAQTYAKDPHSLYNIEANVYQSHVNRLSRSCKVEQREKYMMRQRASLYYSGQAQKDLIEKSEKYPTKSCDELQDLLNKHG